jgi:hypothetical protein
MINFVLPVFYLFYLLVICLSYDGEVGTSIIYENNEVRIWNFTLAPGQSTSMHRHEYDYYFVAIKPSQLEVFGEDGSRLFDFTATGTFGFTIDGDYLQPVNKTLPWPVPRIHSAKNIGTYEYHEILFELKNPNRNFVSNVIEMMYMNEEPSMDWGDDEDLYFDFFD